MPRMSFSQIAAGQVAASATLTAPASQRVPHQVALTVTLYRGTSFVDLTWSIADKKADCDLDGLLETDVLTRTRAALSRSQ